MADCRWQFWIDVGGTFTDCLARRPDGTLLRSKVLSSGVTKGCLGEGSSALRILDPARRADPDQFWRGYRLQLLDEHGAFLEDTHVERFDRQSGAFELTSPLHRIVGAGQPYELLGDEEAPLLAMRYVLALPREAPLPRSTVKLGTTKGTNALLTRRGARCALVTTQGFADILRIGYQNRPRLFELSIRKPEPLYVDVAEVDERVAADGTVLVTPREASVRESLLRLWNGGIRSLAIALLHADRYPAHERFVERLAREIGFKDVSCSSHVAPFMKLVSRGDTTVVDAYLNPVLRDYVVSLQKSIGGSSESEREESRSSIVAQHTVAIEPAAGDAESELRFLTSAGGLVAANSFRGKDSVLSGPAGGVVGFSRVAQSAGFQHAIGFDMGGTSTDVSRFDGQFDREFETEKAGVRIVAPMMAIETVAAGGGSICWFDGVKLCVGPDSAGADPGPACYGRGGPLTVTDVNLFLGRLHANHFPFPLHRAVVELRLSSLADEITGAVGARYELVALAQGLLRIANLKMAQAIRSVSIAKGYDPREYVLVPFGGAAGQHACAIARELGMSRILCHADAGLLSAYGIGLADVTRHRAVGVYRRFTQIPLEELEDIFERLAIDATQEVIVEGISAGQISVIRSLEMRYVGTDIPLTIPQPLDHDFRREFADRHQKLYGYVHVSRELEVTTVRVEAIGKSGESLSSSRRLAGQNATPAEIVRTCFPNGSCDTNVFHRSTIRPGDAIEGPALVLESTSTTVVDPGWNGEFLSGGELLLTFENDSTRQRASDPQRSAAEQNDKHRSPDPTGTADPALLEVFNNHFAAIATQMGITLRNTSSSVNVKERLDFSCAVFAANGDLVVNAPHIPVHLGAMSETVKRTIDNNSSMKPGDVYVTNDPFQGGSHLPDVTVITPVHDADGRVRFFTASRAHHAEIGGITPGSMPPFSKTLAEEGVLIRNFKVVDAGRSRLDELGQLLQSGPYPTRNVHDNLYDASAQIAANHQGGRDLQRLVQQYGWPTVHAYMEHIQRAAEQKVRMALRRLPAGKRTFVDHLDDGSPICVAITIEGETATIDFAGTGKVLTGNLNANPAIVTAAVMYCLRCLLDEDIPLNQGVLSPVKIIVPECLLNPPVGNSPEHCAAVAGGNVETSQRVVDVILGALGLAAASQGTMNNLLFGDRSFGYYETICGGAGATAQCQGADAIHTHMTNTRLTDPEVLEHRYPVRLREFAIRRGSGGAGKNRGGDGVVRRLEFLRELNVSILAQRRGEFLPYGLAGGQPGAAGRNSLAHADGSIEPLPGTTQLTVHSGEILTIETPGGGGFGTAE